MYCHPTDYDVLVIGAGHAGIEAACASARIGARTLLLTQNLDSIGQMSCNPAIGGQAKGQIVREIDALGGIMGLNTDATGIQFRMLNASKGPSVRSPRAQCDKKAYQFRAKAVLERHVNLDIKQGNATAILCDFDGVRGASTDLGVEYRARSVIITTGTFMRGLLHVGMQSRAGGRMGDSASTLSDSLRDLGFEIGRFKTGTPCRLNGRSIDFDRCERQEGDCPPQPFTFNPEDLGGRAGDVFDLNRFANGVFHVEQIACWITHTTRETHEIIRSNLDQSPLYAGRIEGVGPRYCPSIEDKVVRFGEKESHQVFLEPEGRHTEEIYVNGVSTSLPIEVQYAFIRSIPALERAEIMRAGYAVEYDYCPATQLKHTLETKRIPNLYFAGQINGTSGYEEAAAQGLIAGANAALKISKKEPFVLSRADAYIGVLIDDLVIMGTPEPYRMFTSRAEHRLLLRHDNADLRLTPLAFEAGIVEAARAQRVREKSGQLAAAKAEADRIQKDGIPLSRWLRRPENTASKANLSAEFSESIWEMVEIDLKYAGYIVRQEGAVERLRSQDGKRIPASIDYDVINGLRAETRQKLSKVRPETLGQASRISGVTPSDVALLSIMIEKR